MSTLGIIVVIFLIFFLLGGLPTWGYHSYGYAPSGIVFVLIVVALILLLTGRL